VCGGTRYRFCNLPTEFVRLRASAASNEVISTANLTIPHPRPTARRLLSSGPMNQIEGFAMGRTIGAAIGAVIVVMFFLSLAIEHARMPPTQVRVTVSARR
jgi:hypothetical protein